MAGKKPGSGVKRNYLNDIFIRGIARYPKISEPDTGNQYSDGKYKTDIVPDADELKRVSKILKDFGKKCWPDADAVKLPIKKDKKDPSIVFVQAKSGMNKDTGEAKRPLVIDAKKNPMPKGSNIGAGSELRIKVTASDYKKTEKVKTSDGYIDEEVYGITLYLEAVQVIKYVAARDQLAGFESEEGFEANSSDFGDESGDETSQGGDAYDL